MTNSATAAPMWNAECETRSRPPSIAASGTRRRMLPAAWATSARSGRFASTASSSLGVPQPVTATVAPSRRPVRFSEHSSSGPGARTTATSPSRASAAGGMICARISGDSRIETIGRDSWFTCGDKSGSFLGGAGPAIGSRRHAGRIARQTHASSRPRPSPGSGRPARPGSCRRSPPRPFGRRA